jgi:hypothetical protein
MFIAKQKMDFREPSLLKLRDWISIEKLDWVILSQNPAALHLLYKFDWDYSSENPSAINLLEKNIDGINWNWLSEIPALISILEKNLDKVDWVLLSVNPAIFNYDYQKIKEIRKKLNKEVYEYYWHPLKMNYWMFQEENYDNI